MSIKSLIEDADLLINQHRYLGALSLLLIAVGASSVKMFPDGTQSIDQPVDKNGKPIKMRDYERFERFIGGRFQNLIFGESPASEGKRSLRLKKFVDATGVEIKGETAETVLYKQYRNPLIHEADLEQELRDNFEHSDAAGDSYCVRADTSFRFDRGLLTLLRRAVVEAPINGKAFGRPKLTLVARDECADALLLDEIDSTQPRIDGLKRVVLAIGPDGLDMLDNDLINHAVAAILQTGGLMGMMRPYSIKHRRYGDPLCSDEARLTPAGLKALRRIYELFDFVDIAK